MTLYKLSIDEILNTDGLENIFLEYNIPKKVPLDDKIEGAEDVLIQAIEANKRYEKYYSYKQLPIVMKIANLVGKSGDFSSIDFARNVFLYQVKNLGIPKTQADGHFDPPLIEDVAKRNSVDLSTVYTFWKNKLKGNWLGNRWAGRRLAKERKEGVYQYPVKSAQIVGDFTGSRPSDKRHAAGHWGMDLANSKGTPIFPTAPGIVTGAGDYGKGGLGVKIDHQNGVESYYAHNSLLNVKVGDKVDFDTVIAQMGATGNAAGTQPHVHFEVRVAGSKIDPKKIIGTPVKTKL